MRKVLWIGLFVAILVFWQWHFSHESAEAFASVATVATARVMDSWPSAEISMSPLDGFTLDANAFLTDTEELSEIDALTDTEVMTDTETMTETVEMTDTEAMTETMSMTDTMGMDDEEKGYTPVSVFYVTDRNATGSDDPVRKYGTARGATLSFGTCIVTIPDTHAIGEMELPSIWAAEFSADPARHIILTDVNQLNEAECYRQFNARTADTGEVFVFIHGYNVTFAEAARRTAQMAYDLRFQGAPIFYSWPSKGTYWGYPADGESIQRSTPHIKRLLAEVVAQTNAHTIHLIGHSMGNRGLTDALIELRTELPEAQLEKFNQIILAAPDIDAEVFKEQIAPQIAPLGEQVTLYASSSDLALLISKWWHAFSRAGESGNGLVIVDGIYTIDASTVNTDFIGHGYPYNLTIIADIFEMFHDRDFPDDRFNLEIVETQAGRYWRFRRTR